MSKYILSAPAKQDLRDIKNYLVRFSLSTGSRFLDAFEEKCRLLAQFPEIGSSREELSPMLRSSPVDKYVIFYRQIKKGIQVERVLSVYRDFDEVFEKG